MHLFPVSSSVAVEPPENYFESGMRRGKEKEGLVQSGGEAIANCRQVY
jgi:hypothetical protein